MELGNFVFRIPTNCLPGGAGGYPVNVDISIIGESGITYLSYSEKAGFRAEAKSPTEVRVWAERASSEVLEDDIAIYWKTASAFAPHALY